MRRLGGVLCLMVTTFLVACSSNGGPQAPTVARIEITPSAVLLTAAGQQKQLSAQAFDGQGNLLDVEITWSTSDASQVLMDTDGLLTSVTPLGSAQVFALAEGVRSAPAVVIVADPVDGAILVSDSQVLEGPTLLNAELGSIVGSRLEYLLTDLATPQPGEVLLASESVPLAGQVESATAEGDAVRVVLEVVPGTQLFDEISFEQSFDLVHIEPVLADLPGHIAVVSGSDGTRISYTPTPGLSLQQSRFKCDGSVATMIDVTTFKLEQSVDGEVIVTYDERDDTVLAAGIVLKGKYGVKATGGLFLKAGLKGEATCTIRLWTRPIPIAGALSILVRPTLAIDAELKIKGTITAVTLEAGVKGEIATSMELGFMYTASQDGMNSDFDFINSVSSAVDVSPKYKAPSLQDARFDASLYVGPVLSLRGQIANVGNVSLLDASLIEGRFGVFGELSLAHPTPQAKDAAYASSYSMKLQGELGLGDGVGRVLEALGATDYLGAEFKVTVPAATLAASPTGALAPARTQALPGEEVKFAVTLDNVALPGFGENVKGIDIYMFTDGQEPQRLAAMDQLGSNYFEYTWNVPINASGDYNFVAFVNTWLADGLPLEIAPDSKKTLTIGGICMPFPDDPADPVVPGDPVDPGDPGDPGGGDSNNCVGGTTWTWEWDNQGPADWEYSQGSQTVTASGYTFVYSPIEDAYVATEVTISFSSTNNFGASNGAHCTSTAIKTATLEHPLSDDGGYFNNPDAEWSAVIHYYGEGLEAFIPPGTYTGSGSALLEGVESSLSCDDGRSSSDTNVRSLVLFQMPDPFFGDEPAIIQPGGVMAGTFQVENTSEESVTSTWDLVFPGLGDD